MIKFKWADSPFILKSHEHDSSKIIIIELLMLNALYHRNVVFEEITHNFMHIHCDDLELCFHCSWSYVELISKCYTDTHLFFHAFIPIFHGDSHKLLYSMCIQVLASTIQKGIAEKFHFFRVFVETCLRATVNEQLVSIN